MNTKITAISALLFSCLALLTAPVMGEANTYFSDRDPGPKPRLALNGSYHALYNSMNNGEVHSIRPGAVISYGQPMVTSYQGKSYWEIDVTYKNYAAGGSILIGQARALVRNGTVLYWLAPKGDRRIP